MSPWRKGTQKISFYNGPQMKRMSYFNGSMEEPKGKGQKPLRTQQQEHANVTQDADREENEPHCSGQSDRLDNGTERGQGRTAESIGGGAANNSF